MKRKHCHGFYHQALGLALLGSRAVHAPSNAQVIYVATQGSQVLQDGHAARSRDLRITQLRKPLCACVRPCVAGARQSLEVGHTRSPLSSPTNFLRPAHLSYSLS